MQVEITLSSDEALRLWAIETAVEAGVDIMSVIYWADELIAYVLAAKADPRDACK